MVYRAITVSGAAFQLLLLALRIFYFMEAGVSASRLLQATNPRIGFPQKVIYMSQPPYNIRLTTYLLGNKLPGKSHKGLGSSAFARHYLRNHFCFLFLRVLRCFSSPRLPPPHYGFMCWYLSSSLRWVPPFGYPRLYGYLRLNVAFRSLSRPSSAPGA